MTRVRTAPRMLNPAVTSECGAAALVVFDLVPPALCAAGAYVLQPQLCGPWLWLSRHPAYAQILKLATVQGCTVVAEQGPATVRVLVRDAKRAAAEGLRTYRALNTAEGMSWLLRYLTSQ